MSLGPALASCIVSNRQVNLEYLQASRLLEALLECFRLCEIEPLSYSKLRGFNNGAQARSSSDI